MSEPLSDVERMRVDLIRAADVAGTRPPWAHFPHCPQCHRRLWSATSGRAPEPLDACPHCATPLDLDARPSCAVCTRRLGRDDAEHGVCLPCRRVAAAEARANPEKENPMSITDEAPLAPLVRAVYIRGSWSLTVKCPSCGHLHVHGGGSDRYRAGDFLGHRAADCPSRCLSHGRHERGNGYVLTDPDDFIGRAIREQGL